MNRAKIKKDCSIYYNKGSEKYWDQIITLVNYLGVKKLDENNKFNRISLLEYVSGEYDKDNTKPSEIVFSSAID